MSGLKDRDPAEPQAAGETLGLQGAGAGGSGCLQTVPNGDPERGDPEATGAEPAGWGEMQGLDLTAAFAEHKPGDTLWPLYPSPGPVSGSDQILQPLQVCP